LENAFRARPCFPVALLIAVASSVEVRRYRFSWFSYTPVGGESRHAYASGTSTTGLATSPWPRASGGSCGCRHLHRLQGAFSSRRSARYRGRLLRAISGGPAGFTRVFPRKDFAAEQPTKTQPPSSQWRAILTAALLSPKTCRVLIEDRGANAPKKSGKHLKT
jgi:hypothetical protein